MKAIGIFDSGIGGLTVFSQVEKLLPSENLIYLGDTARVPYGTKSKETIERFAQEDTQFLLQKNVKFMIAACNTVSALALPFLKKEMNIPIMGVIEPAVQKAIFLSQNSRIGVIGTRATIESKAYDMAFAQLDPSVQVFSQACPLLVPLVEEGWLNEPEAFSITQKYFEPLIEKKIDTLILGCTHYPLLSAIIQKAIGEKVTLIDSAKATAEVCLKTLDERNLLNKNQQGQHQFFVTDDTEGFRKKGEKFLKRPMSHVERADLEQP
ncbi:MAG: glutamate racemase [Chlamydiae bacterium]|nr:glutamate racemase [Chlamydiota bacterium]MBI3277687.1 glutamate racemase [Chlamydiota bacterium]